MKGHVNPVILALLALSAASPLSAATLKNASSDMTFERVDSASSGTCPTEIKPGDTVSINGYCGYDLCGGGAGFDQNQGCLELAPSNPHAQGGYSTYVGLSSYSANAPVAFGLDSQVPYDFKATTDAGVTTFSESSLVYRSVTQIDSNKQPVTLPANLSTYTSLPFRGVNISGLEYDGVYFDALFQLPDLPDMRYFAKQGMNTVRLPIRWEFLIHDAGSNLNSSDPLSPNINQAYLDAVHDVVRKYLDHGVNVILDLHGYMHFCKTGPAVGQNNEPTTPGNCAVVDADGSGKELAYIWGLIAKNFADLAIAHPYTESAGKSQLMFELMNEPYWDQGESSPLTTQSLLKDDVAAINAIRQEKLDNYIVLDGNNWSGLHSWTTATDPNGVTNAQVFTAENLDPAKYGHLAVDVHQYFDYNMSGIHPSCLSLADFQSQANFKQFADWMHDQKMPVILGEFGIPVDSTCQADMNWLLQQVHANAYSAGQGGFIGWTAWRSNRHDSFNFNELQAADANVYCYGTGQCLGITKGQANSLMETIFSQYLTKK